MTLAKALTTCVLLLSSLPLTCRADVTEGRSTAAITLTTNPGVSTILVSMTLPAVGQYWAVGKASLVNWTGQEDYTRCGLASNGAVLDSAVMALGGHIAPSAATLVSEAKITTTVANQVVTLQCSHDHALAGIYADGGAALEVTSSPAGPQGDRGAMGSIGPAGPAGSTTGACSPNVDPNAPQNLQCHCAAGKTLLSQVQTPGRCSVTTQINACSAAGYAWSQGQNGASYNAACCVCSS